MLQSMGYQRIRHDLVTEHQHTHKFVAEVTFVLIFYLFIYLLILAALGPHCCLRAFSRCGKQGPLSSCGSRPSHCGGFSCYVAWSLEHRLGSCGSRAWLPSGMWDLPRAGTQPVSPTLAGRFLITGPLGKSKAPSFNTIIWASGLQNLDWQR